MPNYICTYKTLIGNGKICHKLFLLKIVNSPDYRPTGVENLTGAGTGVANFEMQGPGPGPGPGLGLTLAIRFLINVPI